MDPRLKVDDPYKGYTVYTNASKEGLGGLLSQEGHVVCYESHKLKENEGNYVVHDRELDTLVNVLKMAPLPVTEKVPFVDRQHLCKEYVYSARAKFQKSKMNGCLK